MCKTACLVQTSEGLLATEMAKWCSSTLRSTRPLVLFSFSASFLKTLKGFCEVFSPSSLSHSGRSGRERKYGILKRKKTALKKRKHAEPSMELFLLSESINRGSIVDHCGLSVIPLHIMFSLMRNSVYYHRWQNTEVKNKQQGYIQSL